MNILIRKSVCWFAIQISFIILVSCNNNVQTNEHLSDVTINDITEEDEPVKYVTLQNQLFFDELSANGKLTAKRKINLKFEKESEIKRINIQNGDFVQMGQLLALLDDKTELLNLTRAKLTYQQALLDYQDQLLRAGYRLIDTASIQAEVKEIARLRSGLSRSEIELKQALSDLQKTRLLAPFTGKVANINIKSNSKTGSSDFLCTLIDDNSFDVDFQILEEELLFTRQASSLAVTPFSNDSVQIMGRVVSINPLIDEAGMINVKASVIGKSDLLIDGMNVRVIIRSKRSKQLVVPKEAVVDRQGKKVVFTLVDSLAKWNYVEIAGENNSSYAIKSGLRTGDKVIYEGNFNLANDKPVKVDTEL